MYVEEVGCSEGLPLAVVVVAATAAVRPEEVELRRPLVEGSALDLLRL